MTALKKRAYALENKFAHDEEFEFKAQARRNAIIGLWAAAVMHRTDAQAYAEELKTAHVNELDGAFVRLRRDFDAAGIEMLDDDLRNRMTYMLRRVADEMFDGR